MGRALAINDIVVESTISLIANCTDWAKHRRRKAAAKCHMRLDLQSFLPKFALVEPAKYSDPTVAYEICSGIKAGEIVVFDKAYIDFVHLYRLEQREVFWVSRAKDNMQYKTIQKNKVKGKVIRDEFIELTISKTNSQYPKKLRLVEAIVEVDGKEKQMVFITNNLQWAASSICDLYKSRWAVEVLFKQ
ncbi:MAG: IS4 family transposase [bacterium]|nr:IS4 family transposase [bacterium]